MRLTQLAFLGLSLVATAACRGGGGDDDGDDTPPADGPIGGDDVTIQEIQSDDMPKGTAVGLKGVVVVAIDKFGDRTGDIWVGEPAGGEFSGIKVFGAPLDQIGGLVPGDIVTIADAEKDEFALTDDTSGRTVTELKPAGGGTMTVLKTGNGPLPPASMVDAKAIGALEPAAQDAEWEKWEGVRINVVNARQLTPVGTFGAGGDDQKKFDATGNLVVESVLAGFPVASVADVCYAGIVGVGDYFFDHLLLPTAETDFSFDGTGCEAITRVTATIPEIQGGTIGDVDVNDVFVTAISFNKKNLWVASSLTAAANEGIFVFRGNGAAVLPAEITVGAKINVRGTAVEQNNDATGDTVTQIAGGATVTLVTAGTTAPTPITNKTAAELTIAATGEPFESVIVTLTNVKVMSVGDANNFFVAQLKQGVTQFLADDDIFRFLPANLNECYASITGIWTYQVFDNAYGFLPLAVGTGTGVCP